MLTQILVQINLWEYYSLYFYCLMNSEFLEQLELLNLNRSRASSQTSVLDDIGDPLSNRLSQSINLADALESSNEMMVVGRFR